MAQMPPGMAQMPPGMAQMPPGMTQAAYEAAVSGYDGYAEGDGICETCGTIGGCECGGGFAARPSRIWGQAEYLLWWSQKRYLPPLVTTSPQGTPQATAGRLGFPTTSILFGDEDVGDDAQSGFRASMGFWFNQLQTVGMGVRYFWVGDEDDTYSASSDGNPILSRPFYNEFLNQQDALLVAYPGLSSGSVNMTTTNKAQGGDVFLRMLLHSAYCNRLDLIGGYQYTRVEDSLIASDSAVNQDVGGAVPVGTVVDTRDAFKVDNDFNGGFLGLTAEAEDGRLTWRMLAKVAFGNMRQRASVSGQTTTSIPGGPSVTSDFGLLAQASNIGTVEQDEFAIVPELNLSVGYKLTNQIDLSVGYSFIHWSKILFAGDIVDLRVDPTQTEALPSLQLGDGDGFWYQGLSFGTHVRF